MIYFIVAIFLGVAILVYYYFARSFGLPAKIEIAKKLLEDDNPQKAIELLKKILDIETGQPMARFLLAKAYALMNQNILAISELKKLLNTTSYKKFLKESDVRYFLAEIFEKSQEYAKQIAEYKLIQALNPNDIFVNKKLGIVYYDQKDYEKAYQSLKRVYSKDKNASDILYPLGHSAFETKNYGEAKDYLSRCINNNPNQLEAHYYLGLLFKSEKKHDKALEHFNKAIESPEFREKSYFYIGISQMEKNEIDKAIEAFSSILLEKNEINLDAAYFRSICHEKKGEIAKAMEIWEELVGEYNNHRKVSEKIIQYNDISQSDNLLWFFGLEKEKTIKVISDMIKSLKLLPVKATSISEHLFLHTAFKSQTKVDAPTLIMTNKSTQPLSEIQIHDFIKKMDDTKAVNLMIITPAPINKGAENIIANYDIKVIARSQMDQLLDQVR